MNSPIIVLESIIDITSNLDPSSTKSSNFKLNSYDKVYVLSTIFNLYLGFIYVLFNIVISLLDILICESSKSRTSFLFSISLSLY
jgi:hypothetical protein